MSKPCEEVRPLLAELAYGEATPEVAETVREHLGSCLPCRRYQRAIDAVRSDLQAWEPAEESVGRGITFIAPAPASSGVWGNRWTRALAIAASFMIGAFLMAAAVNLNVRSDADGWTVSTSLWGSPAAPSERSAEPLVAGAVQESPPVEAQATPRLVSLDQMDAAELEGWLDRQLAARGVAPAASVVPEQLTDTQWEQVSAGVNRLLDDSIARRDSQHEQILREMVAASEARQVDFFQNTLAMLYEAMETEREDALFSLASQFGLMQVDTDRRIHQANSRIDSLVTQVSSPPRERQPEQ